MAHFFPRSSATYKKSQQSCLLPCFALCDLCLSSLVSLLLTMSYFSLEDIIATQVRDKTMEIKLTFIHTPLPLFQERLPVRVPPTSAPIPGLAFLDPTLDAPGQNEDGEDDPALPPGSKLELPLWMVDSLTRRAKLGSSGGLEVSLPPIYSFAKRAGQLKADPLALALPRSEETSRVFSNPLCNFCRKFPELVPFTSTLRAAS